MLFICGGTFEGLEKLIDARVSDKSLGFGAHGASRSDQRFSQLMRRLLPEDLLRFGFIPEFVGRLPVVVTLDPLDREALVRILTEPKNALVKQYQKFFEWDQVDLEFTPESLQAIADEALKRGTGARALRTVIEETMLDIMYEIPSQKTARKCLVTAETITQNQPPVLLSAAQWRAQNRRESA